MEPSPRRGTKKEASESGNEAASLRSRRISPAASSSRSLAPSARDKHRPREAYSVYHPRARHSGSEFCAKARCFTGVHQQEQPVRRCSCHAGAKHAWRTTRCCSRDSAIGAQAAKIRADFTVHFGRGTHSGNALGEPRAAQSRRTSIPWMLKRTCERQLVTSVTCSAPRKVPKQQLSTVPETRLAGFRPSPGAVHVLRIPRILVPEKYGSMRKNGPGRDGRFGALARQTAQYRGASILPHDGSR